MTPSAAGAQVPAEVDADAVVIGIDIGGTGTRFVAVDSARQVVGQAQVRTPSSLPAPDRRAFFLGNVDDVAGGRPIVAVGIGASGPVVDGVIRNPDTLPALSGTPFVTELRDDLRVPVLIDNDTVVAAIAEYEVGAARGAAALLHVTFGTGIGTAFLLRGEPFRGGDGEHPEGGHIATTVASRPCYCGRDQCWEQAASRTTLQLAATSLLGTPADDRNAIAALGARADDGDPAAEEVFRRYGTALADGLGTLLALYRPTHVTLGGSVAVEFPRFARALDEALAPLGVWISRCSMAASPLGDVGGAIGAALMAHRARDDVSAA